MKPETAEALHRRELIEKLLCWKFGGDPVFENPARVAAVKKALAEQSTPVLEEWNKSAEFEEFRRKTGKAARP